MAITGGTLLGTALRDTSNVTGYTTGSFTPSATALVCALIGWTHTATGLVAPTVTGGGLTWTGPLDQNAFNTVAVPLIYSAWYWAAVGATPSAMTVTASFASARTGCAIDVIEFLGADTTAPRAQGVTAADPVTILITGTLPSAPAATSACVSFSMNDANLRHNPRAGWTELADIGFTLPTFNMQTQVILPPGEQVGAAAKTGGGANINMAITVVEIAMAGGAAGGHPTMRRFGGVRFAMRNREGKGQRVY